MNNQIVKRKILTKVRRNYLHKTPEDEDEEHKVEVLQEIDDQPFQMISTSFGIVEKHRKFCVGVRFLNTFASVHNIRVLNHPMCKGVTFNLQLNDNIPRIPWEYYVKRLESYGDLNLATWANRLRVHHTLYPKVISDLTELVKSEDPEICANIRRMRKRVALAHQEIQENYPYKCVTMFSGKNETIPLSATYSDRFLKEMEHTPDEFVGWVKEHGIPRLFKGESPLQREVARAFFDCTIYQGDPVKYGPEYTTYIYDKNGKKKRAVVQLVLTMEPTEEGAFFTGYAVLKGLDTRQDLRAELQVEPLKCIKDEDDSDDQNDQSDQESLEEQSIDLGSSRKSSEEDILY